MSFDSWSRSVTLPSNDLSINGKTWKLLGEAYAAGYTDTPMLFAELKEIQEMAKRVDTPLYSHEFILRAIIKRIDLIRAHMESNSD